MPRAEKFTVPAKIPEYYSDFLIDFSPNPLTGSLAKITNENAIKQSLKNLILTTMGERFHQETLGSKIKTILFDPIDNISEELLKSSIINTIQKEPRAKLFHLEVVGNPDKNQYNITIFFESIHFPGQVFHLNLLLKRIR